MHKVLQEVSRIGLLELDAQSQIVIALYRSYFFLIYFGIIVAFVSVERTQGMKRKVYYKGETRNI